MTTIFDQLIERRTTTSSLTDTDGINTGETKKGEIDVTTEPPLRKEPDISSLSEVKKGGIDVTTDPPPLHNLETPLNLSTDLYII